MLGGQSGVLHMFGLQITSVPNRSFHYFGFSPVTVFHSGTTYWNKGRQTMAFQMFLNFSFLTCSYQHGH